MKKNTWRWIARILALLICLIGIPFYFGYGNPLPFINPDYSLFDNVWLTVFPIMFIGLGLGWKWEKIGGWIVVLSILIAQIFSLVLGEGVVWHMFVPMLVGCLYLITGYKK